MCAIFGIIGKYHHDLAISAFEKMKHRGDDENYLFLQDNYLFGSYRLSITNTHIPLKTLTHQDNLDILFNGEIYNYQALGDELNLKNPTEHSVIATAYRRWGDKFINHLNGMYAIAIWDKLELKLFRDPLGKKPIYYYHDSKTFVFASEAKAILALITPHLRYEQIPSYLGFGTTISPNTLFKKIHKLQAGECLHLQNNLYTSTIIKELKPKHTSSINAINEVKNQLLSSVEKRIPKEQEVACLLSGGLDSSLIASMATKYLKDKKLHTFSIGYDGYTRHDERIYASQVAKHIDSVHTEINFSKEDFLVAFDELMGLLDEPITDSASIPLYWLCKEIKQAGFKVVLSGDGSDELFFGYKHYTELKEIEPMTKIKHRHWLLNHINANFTMHKEWEWYRRVAEGSLLFRGSSNLFTDKQLNKFLKINVKNNTTFDIIKKYYNYFLSIDAHYLNWYSYIDIKTQVGELFLTKIDRISMSSSLEVRSPFLDIDLVEMALGIDADYRFGDSPKHIIKTIATDYLPHDIIYRKKKGFNYPYMEWLLESHFMKSIHAVQTRYEIFKSSEVEKLIENAKKGHFHHHLYAIIVFCVWLDKKEKLFKKLN